MKSRIASALAVVACATLLGACSGKGSSGSGGNPAAGVVSSSSAPAAGSGSGSDPGAGTATGTAAAPGEAPGGSPGADAHGVTPDPDGDLSSLDQQLSGIDGALSSAEPTHTADDNG